MQLFGNNYSGRVCGNERKPDLPSLWDSKIRLSDPFFQEIIRNPVPFSDSETLGSNRKRQQCRHLFSQRLSWLPSTHCAASYSSLTKGRYSAVKQISRRIRSSA